MKVFNLSTMKKGWFIGNFDPSCLKTDLFEIALKQYNKGDYEEFHFHKIACEYTLIASGKVKMKGIEYGVGSIILMEPGESTDFECLENNTKCVVVKVPCAMNDKYNVNESKSDSDDVSLSE